VGREYELSWVTDQLAVGGAPMSYAALDDLREQGVDAILNLCAEYCDLHWIEADKGFQVYYFPIEDEKAPDLEALEEALEWLDEAIYLGRKVLIHCRFGIGRTGTVLNAYLLRKGLGHKLAGKAMKKLRSRPQNFHQWRFVRRYGKQAGRLTIREPSLESRRLVDLYPFFVDYEKLLAELDKSLADQGGELCGRDHDRCCRELVRTPLVEAVYVNHAINQDLSREERRQAVHRAVEAGKELRQVRARSEAEDRGAAGLWRGRNVLCPLNDYGTCTVFESRPADCRLHDVADADLRLRLRKDLDKGLDDASRRLFLAFAADFPGPEPLVFDLPDVVSGRFVQRFFHFLRQADDNGE
jgi:hypothetical protein